MSPKAARPEFPEHIVTAVLVAHDGAAWLPECLAALRAQRRPPQRLVAVNTGSVDDTAEILRRELGRSAVLDLPRDAGLPAALAAGLAAFDGAPRPAGTSAGATEWVWILHDDAVAEPDALRELLAAATDAPSVGVWGPKILDASGTHLQQVGLTIDSSGRRRTGLDPAEIDQGQRDAAGDVLAVGTAGMLVRRSLWDHLGGLDPALPLYADDVDFGWRASLAGERVRVAPRAVIRHAAALLRGARAPDAVTAAPGAARTHGLQVVLARTSPRLAPLLLARYLAELPLRAVGLLLFARDGTAARAELSALLTLVRQPAAVRRLRDRAPDPSVPHSEVRHLLAPPALRWRRLAEGFAATFGRPAQQEDRRRRLGPVETGPVAAEVEALDVDDSAFLRVLRRPLVLYALALTAVGFVAARGVLGMLHGGRLPLSPAGASDLWATYAAGWHPAGLGHSDPAAPWVAQLAALSTVLLGKPWLAVFLLVVGAVPLAGLSAYAASRAVTDSRPLRLSAGVLYATLPVLTGAIAGGRLDAVVAVILLPVTARAVAGAVRADRVHWHRWAGAGLLLAALVSWAPVLWLVAAISLAGCLALLRRTRRSVAAAGGVLGLPLLLLLPWSVHVATTPTELVRGVGLPEATRSARPLDAVHLVLLQPGGPAQPPVWVLVPLLLALLAGLARGAATARAGLILYAAGGAGALVTSRLSEAAPGAATARYWTGTLLAVAAVGALAGALAAAVGARQGLARYSFGWRQPAALLVAAGVAATVVIDGASWVARGAATPLTAAAEVPLPAYAAAELDRPSSPRLLVLAAEQGSVHYTLLRRADEPTLGDDPALGGPGGAALAAAVRRLAAGLPDAATGLRAAGISLVVVPGSSASQLTALQDVTGLQEVPAAGAQLFQTGTGTGELTVQPPPGSAANPRALLAEPGSADTVLPAGREGRHLVLAEPASPAWRASLDGRPLQPAAAADGWAQAWELPATGGRLQVGRAGEHRAAWLALQAVLLAIAAVLALPRWRRPEVDL